MRYLPDVIDEVLAVLPPDSDIIAALNDIKGSAKYAAPEIQQHWWLEFCDELDGSLPHPPQTDWQRQVYRIVTQSEPPAEETRSEAAQLTTAPCQNSAWIGNKSDYGATSA
jgi:hypothetical protein